MNGSLYDIGDSHHCLSKTIPFLFMSVSEFQEAAKLLHISHACCDICKTPECQVAVQLLLNNHGSKVKRYLSPTVIQIVPSN